MKKKHTPFAFFGGKNGINIHLIRPHKKQRLKRNGGER